MERGRIKRRRVANFEKRVKKVDGRDRYIDLLWHLGVLVSSMHNTWVRSVCGRLKSEFRYSAGIVYIASLGPARRTNIAAIESAAQAVLDGRDAEFKRDQNTSPAVLYDPDTMPPSRWSRRIAFSIVRSTRHMCPTVASAWASDADGVAIFVHPLSEIHGCSAGKPVAGALAMRMITD